MRPEEATLPGKDLVDELLEAAREMPETAGLGDREVLQKMADHYDGGFWNFVTWAVPEPDSEETRLALATRYGAGFAAALLKE